MAITVIKIKMAIICLNKASEIKFPTQTPIKTPVNIEGNNFFK